MKPGSPIHSLPGPDDIHREELPNGLVVLTRANFNSPSVVVQGTLQTGALFESDEKMGLADFTAETLLRGTERRSFQEIYDSLESAAASLSINAGTHTTGFGGKALAEDLDLLLELLAEALQEPIFPGDQVERLRAQLLTALAIRAQDTGDMASMTFDQIVYPGHPYSRPDEGNPETIQAITREDLAEFHRKTYGPRGAVLTVVGAVDPQVAVEKVTRYLGKWENSNQPVMAPLPPLPNPSQPARRKVDIPGKFQADLVVGAAGPERRSPDFLAASLGNNILGVFGMMGRIGGVVREKAGLAYYAYSSLSGGPGPGPWYVSAGVDPGNIEQALDLIQQEIGRFIEAPVSAEELADSQSNFIGRLPLSLESNGGMAAAILNLERYELGLDYYRRYSDLVRAIDRESVHEAAHRYLAQDRLGVGIAGP
jgi:zinc protease